MLIVIVMRSQSASRPGSPKSYIPDVHEVVVRCSSADHEGELVCVYALPISSSFLPCAEHVPLSGQEYFEAGQFRRDVSRF